MASAASYVLWTEHRAHVIEALRWAILLRWPALPTLIKFPILVYIYMRLAPREEEMSVIQFGERYRQTMQSVPGFIPRWRKAGELHFS
ncbi:MAG: protein-S-isoprenylcysteine O-methyltransferase Ste14 [Gammaproteobacteria bacterium]|jgi:protein-S-isoprenylcysteine O-methyltransferase Ste14